METKELKFLRLPAVSSMTGYSKAAIYVHIAAGKFPRPIPLAGRGVAWEHGEVQDWMRARMATRDAASSAVGQ